MSHAGNMKNLILILFAICIILLPACNLGNNNQPDNGLGEKNLPNDGSGDASTTSPSNNLEVHFIDVGQGDSILIDLGDTEILIDGGGRTPGVVTYLNDIVDGNLEVIVATHPHADHIGGLIAVLQAFTVEQVWLNGDTSTSLTYGDFMNVVQAENAQVMTVDRGDVLVVGGLSFTVLSPATLSGSTNNQSIVLGLTYRDIDFLFTGDAEQEAEASMLAAGLLSDIEILKVGHHGSHSSSSLPFLNMVKPEVAIYMAGAGNSYGHPHEETIDALCNIGAEIYGTDIHGTITVIVNSSGYIIQLENQMPAMDCNGNDPPPISAGVQITDIFYDGIVPQVESDEYVEISNLGTEPVNLQGWKLIDIDEGYPELIFPYYILNPGQSIRVYTNEIHPEYGGFSFGQGTAVWNNSDPDTAVLYNAQGDEMSRKSY